MGCTDCFICSKCGRSYSQSDVVGPYCYRCLVEMSAADLYVQVIPIRPIFDHVVLEGGDFFA